MWLLDIIAVTLYISRHKVQHISAYYTIFATCGYIEHM